MTSQECIGSRFKVLHSENSGKCVTFELLDEDHTLGNALRHMILKNPDVSFCGYAQPHPNERKISIQVQVNKKDALDAFEKGLKNLLILNNIVKEKIQQASDNFGHVELVDSEDETEELIRKLNIPK